MRTARISQYTIFIVFFAILFFAVFAGSSLWSGQKSGDAIPTAPDAKPPTVTASSADRRAGESKEPFVIEHFITRAEFQENGASRVERETTVHIITEAGVRQFEQLVFGYNSNYQKIEIISVQLRKAGNSTFTSASAIRDSSPIAAEGAHLYSEYREKRVTVAGLGADDTLAYHIATVTTVPIAPGQFWFEHNFLREPQVLDEQLEIRVPSKRSITVKTHSGGDPAITEEGDRRVYRWKTSHPVAENDVSERRRVANSEVPSVQITTFHDWAEMGLWYAQMEGSASTPTDAVSAKAKELTAGRSSQREKIEALYDFVATKITTVSLSLGIDSMPPHAANEVLAAGYGNVQDKHTLFAALLSAVGISADPVLIPSARTIDVALPSPAQFNHLITLIPRGASRKDWIWLDTGAEVAPFRMLAAALRGKKGLLIPSARAKAASEAPVATLVETPSNPPGVQVQKIYVTAKVSAEGKLTAHIHYSLRGDSELALRVAFRHTPPSNWTQLGQLLAAGDGFRGEVTGVKSSDTLETHKPLEVDYQISQPNFLDVSKKRVLLRMPLPALGIPDIAETENDRKPLKLGSPLEVHIRAEVQLPAGFSAGTPASTGLARDYAAYHANYSVTGDIITATRDLTFLQSQISAAALADYNAFAHAVRADEAQGISLEATAAPPAIPANDKTK